MLEVVPMMFLAALVVLGQEPATTAVYTAPHGELARRTSLDTSFACSDGRVIEIDLESSDAGAVKVTRMTYLGEATLEELQTITEGLSPMMSLSSVDVACYPRGGVSIMVNGSALDEHGSPGRWTSTISWTDGISSSRPVLSSRRINARDVTTR